MRTKTLLVLTLASLALDTLLVVMFGGSLWLPGACILVALNLESKITSRAGMVISVAGLLVHGLLVQHPAGALLLAVYFSITVMQAIRYFQLIIQAAAVWFGYLLLLRLAGVELSVAMFVGIACIQTVTTVTVTMLRKTLFFKRKIDF